MEIICLAFGFGVSRKVVYGIIIIDMKFGEMFRLAARSRSFWIFVVLGFLGVMTVALVTIFSIRVATVNVPIHYTPFAKELFLNDEWYYMLAFLLFAVAVYVVHIFMYVKMLAMQKKGLVMIVMLTGLLILLFTVVVTINIFSVIRLRLQI